MMRKIRHILVRVVGTVAVIGAMVSCDPCFHVSVYLQNSTSQTISFCAIKEDTLRSYRQIDTIVLKSGEKRILFQDGTTGYFMREYVPNFMEDAYPFGIKIYYENGDSLVYYPDGSATDFHSPYDYKSYFYHERFDDDNDATYEVLH